MSSRIRFASARNVFEAFPDLGRIVAPPADDPASLDYAQTALSSQRPTDAIIFLAYLLPRLEAVWWAIQCVRAMLGSGADERRCALLTRGCARRRMTIGAPRSRHGTPAVNARRPL